MRVIIAGSREFNDFELLEKECLNIFRELKAQGFNTKKENLEIISGTARGADRLGERFAKKYGLKLKYFPAKWDELGKRAGYIRNEQMALYAKEDKELGVLIAFWNGSKGTKHMIELAEKHGLKVYVVSF